MGKLGHGDDPVLAVIESLCGQRSFLYGSNFENLGQIPQLPLGAVVETRCRFDAAGVHPLASPMPPVLQMLVLPHVLRQEAIIDIALEGSFDDLVALVMTDPLCTRLRMGQVRAMVGEMIQANRKYIKNPRLLA
jgi:alpha-galactosidase